MRYILAALLLTGCMTTEKATNYLVEKGRLPEICADKYPPKIEYKPGKLFTWRDTMYLPGDSVPCPDQIIGRDTVRVFAKCPPSLVIRDTTYQRDTITIENTARVQDLQFKLGDRDAKIMMLEHDLANRTRLMYAFLGGCVFLALGYAIYFLKLR